MAMSMESPRPQARAAAHTLLVDRAPLPAVQPQEENGAGILTGHMSFQGGALVVPDTGRPGLDLPVVRK